MAAALEAGVTRLFRVGGAHAIAALAYGTATIPRVDKIVGPGQPLGRRGQGAGRRRLRDRLLRRADRDRRSSPARGRPDVDRRRSRRAGRARSRRARDLHHLEPAARRARRARRRARRRPDATSSQRSLAAHGAIDRRRDRRTRRWRSPTASRRSTSSCDREALDRGGRSPPARCSSARTRAQAAGDYATGSNHVLPTSGAARFRGGLSAADFVRVMSVQRAHARRACARLAPTIVPLARAEGLEAHAESIEVRLSMSHVPEAAGAVRRAAAAPEREHRRLLAARARGAAPRCAPTRSASIRRTRAADGACAQYLGVDAGSARARQRPRRRHHGARGRATCGRRPAAPVPEAIVPEPAFEIFALRHRGRRRPAGAGDAAARLRVSARRGARGDHAANTRVVFLTNPNNPTGVVDAARRDSHDRAARAAGARSCSSTRRTPSSPARRFIPELAAFPERDRRPDVLEGLRPGRPAHRLPRRRTRTRSTRSAAAVPVYSVNIAAVVAVQAALAGSRSRARLPAAGRASRRRCSTPPASGSG